MSIRSCGCATCRCRAGRWSRSPKRLAKKPKLLILDEATSALTSADVEKVYALLARLKAEGVAILYISHRMHEVDALADRASVFRNGRHIETFDKGARSTAEIVQLMIGRDIATQYPPKPLRPRPNPVLKLENLSWEKRLDRISLSVGAGEIVGLGGLDGQGQKTLLFALFGVLRGVTGAVTVNGVSGAARLSRRGQGAGRRHRARPRGPQDRGPDAADVDRRQSRDRLARRLSTGPFVDRAKERKAVANAIARLQIKIGDKGDAVSTLSGGNQQKVVIAKWLMTEPQIILLNDPTRGIDVGTKQELYRLMRELADQGAAILFYSTDYDELIGCCDRVAIMYDGRIIRELEGAELTETNIVASSLTSRARMARARPPMPSNLAIRLRQNFPLVTAIVLFCVVYLFYHLSHPKGFSPAVLVQNGDEVFTLAMVAMAQTVPVLMAGLDLSVGALMTMVACFASYLLNGTPDGMPLAVDLAGVHLSLGSLPGGVAGLVVGMIICVAIGTLCGFLNGCVVVYGRIQPIIATLATGAIYIGVALFLRPQPGGKIDEDLNWALTNTLGDFASTGTRVRRRRGVLVRALRLDSDAVRAALADRRDRLGSVPAHGGGADHLCCRVRRRRRLYVGAPDQPRQDRRLRARRIFRRLRRIVPGDPDLLRQRRPAAGGRLHLELDRGGCHRRHLAFGRDRQRDRLDLRRAHPARDLVLLPHF